MLWKMEDSIKLDKLNNQLFELDIKVDKKRKQIAMLYVKVHKYQNKELNK